MIVVQTLLSQKVSKDKTLHSILIYLEYEEIKFLNSATFYGARFWIQGAAISIFRKGRIGQCPNARMASTPLSQGGLDNQTSIGLNWSNHLARRRRKLSGIDHLSYKILDF